MGPILQPLDLAKLPHCAPLNEAFQWRTEDGCYAQGVMAWYMTLVYNPEMVEPPPASWLEVFEEPRFDNSLGLISAFNLGLPEVIAAAYFNGPLDEHLDEVIKKASDMKKQVKLWWTSESQMEQALRNRQVSSGTYFHDVSQLLVQDGYALESVFPREGAFRNVGKFGLLSNSTRRDEAHAFIDFCARPASQAMFAREMGLAPVISREQAGLSVEEFNRVSTEIPSIDPASEFIVANSSRMQRKWQRMLTS